jgi:hypothetical protein
MDQQAIYMEMYKECCNQGRHHETPRSTITSISFAFARATLYSPADASCTVTR